VNKTQIWCDVCGKEMKLQMQPHGSGNFENDIWELWGPNARGQDYELCSLECVKFQVEALISNRPKDANENN